MFISAQRLIYCGQKNLFSHLVLISKTITIELAHCILAVSAELLAILEIYPSHSLCLNGLYHLLSCCHASNFSLHHYDSLGVERQWGLLETLMLMYSIYDNPCEYYFLSVTTNLVWL